MTLIDFERILIIHVSMLSLLSPENSPKSHNFSTMKKLFVEKTFYSYLLLGLTSFFSVKIAGLFLKIVTLLYLSKID